MIKHFKAIAATMSMVVMLVTSGIPVMAAEQIPDTGDIIVSDETIAGTQNVVDEGTVQATSSYFQSFSYSGTLSQGKYLGSVYLSQSAATVNWNIGTTGSSGLVRFALTNQSTGELRQVTAVADNKLGSLTWVGSLPAGTYDVSIAYVSKSGIKGLNLYFYH